MTSKLYDELYPKLNFLIGIKTNFNEFYNSWWTDKCLNYKGTKLSDYYDIFFSRFVTFNSLYNTIIYTKEKIGLLEKKTNKKNKIVDRQDKEKATTLMSKELLDSDLEIFFSKPKIIKSINDLIDILEYKKFVITHTYPDDDLLIFAKLKNTDKREKYLGLLELLYNVRCNMFHGSKGYEQDQITLLKPINEIILHIVNFTYNSFEKMTSSLIKNTEEEIKTLEEKL